jgi:hypothetical protein
LTMPMRGGLRDPLLTGPVREKRKQDTTEEDDDSCDVSTSVTPSDLDLPFSQPNPTILPRNPLRYSKKQQTKQPVNQAAESVATSIAELVQVAKTATLNATGTSEDRAASIEAISQLLTEFHGDLGPDGISTAHNLLRDPVNASVFNRIETRIIKRQWLEAMGIKFHTSE